jgi:hypothetical protein
MEQYQYHQMNIVQIGGNQNNLGFSDNYKGMKLYELYNQVLNEDFKTQTQKFIKQGIDVEIVKPYIEKFKFIRDKQYKEAKADINGVEVPVERRFDIDAYNDFHELERVVDYVSGQRSVGSSMKGDIEVSGEAVFKNDNVEVYYADSPRACIKYKGSVPYSWCVARSDSSNMFYTYRFKPYEPAFYFIKDVKATQKEFKVWNMTKNVFRGSFSNPYHFFVIQVPKNVNPEDDKKEQYIVTSANNDGDKQMSWDDIVKLNPKLKPIKEVLKPKPFTPEERAQHERFKNGIGDKEFRKLSYEDKRTYLDIYPTIGKPITYEQLTSLPDDLMNLYVSFGVGLDNEQDEFVKENKPKIYKRYIDITKRKFDEYMSRESYYERVRLSLNFSELKTLSDENITKYLKNTSSRNINDMIHTFGWDAYYFIKKYIPEKFDKSDEGIIDLLRTGDEESIFKLNELVPSGVEVDIYMDKIRFDIESFTNEAMFDTFKVKDGVEWLYNRVSEGSYYDGYYDNYFDGDDETMDREVREVINKVLTTNDDLKSDFLSLGLNWDEATVLDLVDTYDKLSDIERTITDEFTEAQSEAQDNAGSELGNKIERIVEVKYNEIFINIKALVIYLHDNKFFTTDPDEFKDNMKDLLEDILSHYDLPTDYYEFDEMVREAGYSNMVVDYNTIYNNTESSIKDALYEFVEEKVEDESDTTGNTDNKLKRLKSEVINHLNKTLKELGEDPNANRIENELVLIDINRQRFKLSGQVFITLTNKKTNKTDDGYIYINDLPTYFRNYKLFEAIIHFKRLIEYD